MTNTKFKNSVIALAIGLVMVSCGGRSGNQQSGTATSGTAKVETKANDYANQEVWTKLSASDWQKVVKANYDFDLTIPSGWSFAEGEKDNINPSYWIAFKPEADDFNAAVAALHHYWFDLTASIIPADGNFQISSEIITNEKGEPIGRKDVKGDKFTELKVNNFFGIESLQPDLWYFNTPKGAVQISFTGVERGQYVRITLVYMGNKAE